MCINDDKLLVIHKPRRLGQRWIVEAQLYTPMGVVELRAEGNELLAARALERLQPAIVGGVFEDVSKAVRRVAQSKAFSQVMKGAQSVLSNPLFRSVTSKLPIVSSIVDGADAAFMIAEGIRSGKVDATHMLEKAKQMAASSDPATAKKGKVLLQGVNVAQTAATIWAQYQAGDRNARRTVRALRQGARAGDEAQTAALKAIKAARRFQLRETAAELVRSAMNGDSKASAKLTAIWNDAKGGDKNAKEAAKLLRSVVIEHPTERAEVGAELSAHEDAAADVVEGINVAAKPLNAADAAIKRKLVELRSYNRNKVAA
jgi:hypothetical protein